jgi:DNA-binding CsgD family transcriptional regulator/tetratricopeptide (TPR) repeat protein
VFDRKRAELVGRAEELQALASGLAVLRSGAGWIATVRGPAGVGKSRLVHEITTIARANGVPVMIGSADEDAPRDPYAPIAEALRSGFASFADDAERHAVAMASPAVLSLLPELAANADDVQRRPDLDRAAIAEAVVSILRTLAREKGALLIIEDIHNAPRATSSLVRYLSRRLPALPVGIILTWRSEESAAASARMIEAGLRSSHAPGPSIDLRALTWPETREFARRLLDLSELPPTAFVDALFERTEGNPFYIEEIVSAIERPNPRSAPELPAQLPDTLHGVLGHRLAGLTRPARRVIANAAVFGRRFNGQLLTDIAGFDERTVNRSLEAAMERGVIVEDGGQLHFRHALLREVAVASLPPTERRRLHLRIAHAMEREQRDSAIDPSASLAYHYGEAGDRESQRFYAERAGDAAMASGAVREGASWYSEALRLADELGEEQLIPLLRKSANTFMADWRLADAEAAYERLIGEHRKSGDQHALGEALVQSAMTLFNDSPRRLQRLETALNVLAPLGDSEALARAEAALATLYQNMDRREAFEMGISALGKARALNLPDAEILGLRVVGTIATHGDFALGARLLRRSIRIATQRGDTANAFLATFNLAGACIRVGRWDEAIAYLQPAYDAAVRQNVPDGIGSGLIRLAEIALSRGNWDEAEDYLGQTRERINVTDFSARLMLAIQQAHLDVRRGRFQAAIDAIGAIEDEVRESAQLHDIASTQHLLGLARLGAGDPARAQEHAEQMLESSHSMGEGYNLLPFVEFACEAFLANGRIERARSLIDEAGSVVATLRESLAPERIRSLAGEPSEMESDSSMRAEDDQHAKAIAVLRLCEGMIAEAESRREDAVKAYEDALAFFRLTDRPYEIARLRLKLATALLARGMNDDRGHARADLESAGETFARLGAAELAAVEGLLRSHRLVRSGPRGAGEGLSEREHEIAALVAAGLSNRQIGKTLVLSPKTVEHHVSRILGKLQLASRAALPAHVSARSEAPSQPARSPSD